MPDYIEKQCPECGQQLRFPNNVGGIVMKCPSCGKRFHSDFKIGNVGGRKQQGVAVRIFEMPTRLVDRIFRFLS
ncbi:MAG: hypothetical protein KAR01_09205 [Desulfocapsa sp.]|nr:hypothetical protein [Desulfocapsa sp.]